MVTKDRVALFLGGVMLVGSMETSFYGGNFFIAAVLLVVGGLCLIYGYTLNQQRYDVIPILENRLQLLNQEMADFRAIVEKTPKQEDANAIIGRMSTLVELSSESGKSLEKLIPFAEGEINKIHREISALKVIMENTPKRSDLKILTEELSSFSDLPLKIDNALKQFLLEARELDELTHEKNKEILSDTKKNNEKLIEDCRMTIDDTVSKIRQELSKVIKDADILKNDYLKANNELIEMQVRVAEDTKNNIVVIGQETENKMNTILAKIQNFNEDANGNLKTLGKNLNDSVKELCEEIGENIENLDSGIRKKHSKLVDKLSKDVESMCQSIDTLAQSYDEFQKHNETLVQAFTKMSEEDAKIIKSIIPE